MTPEVPPEITSLLKAWSGGDRDALERLTPLVYDQLRRIAQHYMSAERPGHTLQATALVNEAYIRLVDGTRVNWNDRNHFFAIAAQVMRRILVDAARARVAGKRGGKSGNVGPTVDLDLSRIPDLDDARSSEMIALNDALDALAQWDPRKARVVELRFFGGLSLEETAQLLDVSPQTVKRDWSMARAWLTKELQS